MKINGIVTQILNMNNDGVPHHYYIEIKTQYNEHKYFSVHKNDIKDLYIDLAIVIHNFIDKKVVISPLDNICTKIIAFKLDFFNKKDFNHIAERVLKNII